MNEICKLQASIENELKKAVENLGGKVEHIPGLTLCPKEEWGDYSLPCFNLKGVLKKLKPQEINNPVAISKKLSSLLEKSCLFFNVSPVGPYLNLSLNCEILSKAVISTILKEEESFGKYKNPAPKNIVIEFSAPNTNKPQHLGHVRNNVLGEAISRILSHAGQNITKVNLINDRGIHICKSMLAYKMWGNETDPQKAKIKGDHLIGFFYVLFNKKYEEEYQVWLQNPKNPKISKDIYFNKYSELGKKAKDMLLLWENNDPQTITLWKKLNDWALKGFNQTYKELGVSFDKTYFESETYKLGKDIIKKGLQQNIFSFRHDQAVVYKQKKVVLRNDGTSVYITQDLGTAIARKKEFNFDSMIYVVGNEQNHHFKILFSILEDLNPNFKNQLYHLSYGMVNLPSGRMKSREGIVVDADNIIKDMTHIAQNIIKTTQSSFDQDSLDYRSKIIGLGALKYFLLDINPKSTIEFDPEQSLNFLGKTGPYILMNYARTQSIISKAGGLPLFNSDDLSSLKTKEEKKVLLKLYDWPDTLIKAANELNPSWITEYLFKLSKAFAYIFTDKAKHSILSCHNTKLKNSRLYLVNAVGITLKTGLNLLGIQTLQKM